MYSERRISFVTTPYAFLQNYVRGKQFLQDTTCKARTAPAWKISQLNLKGTARVTSDMPSHRIVLLLCAQENDHPQSRTRATKETVNSVVWSREAEWDVW